MTPVPVVPVPTPASTSPYAPTTPAPVSTPQPSATPAATPSSASQTPESGEIPIDNSTGEADYDATLGDDLTRRVRRLLRG